MDVGNVGNAENKTNNVELKPHLSYDLIGNMLLDYLDFDTQLRISECNKKCRELFCQRQSQRLKELETDYPACTFDYRKKTIRNIIDFDRLRRAFAVYYNIINMECMNKKRSVNLLSRYKFTQDLYLKNVSQLSGIKRVQFKDLGEHDVDIKKISDKYNSFKNGYIFYYYLTTGLNVHLTEKKLKKNALKLNKNENENGNKNKRGNNNKRGRTTSRRIIYDKLTW